MFVLLASLSAFLLVILAAAFVASYLTDESQLEQMGKALKALFVPATVAGLSVAAVKAVLDGSTVNLDESKPSADEEFARLFRELVIDGRRRHRADRLVIFIDELDRCSPQDVVATLTAIKTFLDQDDCVFVVAADRNVLEEALVAELTQATPARESAPYYSSASAFLDKVFHHQVQLPPLRPTSLTQFARGLVIERGGLWSEIRERSGTAGLERLIYILVPSHVVSPRRVKVLLNNFASNARVAQGRGISWLERCDELAKLTVLQTEFPALATELPLDPRLPELLMGDVATLRPPLEVRRQLVRFRLPPDTDSDRTPDELDELLGPVEDDDTPGDSETDHVLDPVVGHPAEQERNRVAEAQAVNLRRYLARCKSREVPSIGPDLLYLAYAGADVGLKDPAIGAVLEREAREFPRRAASASEAWTGAQAVLAGKALATMAEHEFGPERVNVLESLVAIAHLRPDEPDLAEMALTKLDSEAVAEFPIEALQLAAGVAFRTPGVASTRVLDDIVSDARILVRDSDLAEFVVGLSALSDTASDAVLTVVVNSLSSSAVVAESVLRSGDLESVQRFMADSRVKEALRNGARAPESGDAFASGLFDAAGAREDESPEAGKELLWLYLWDGTAYVVVRDRAPVLLSDGSETRRISHVLRGLLWADPEDWETWTELLPRGTATSGGPAWWPASAKVVIGRYLEDGLRSANEVVAERLSLIFSLVHEEDLDELIETLDESLRFREWIGQTEQLNVPRSVLTSLGALTDEFKGTSGKRFADAVSRDLGRVFLAEEGAVAPIDTSQGADAVRALVEVLPLSAGVALADALNTRDFPTSTVVASRQAALLFELLEMTQSDLELNEVKLVNALGVSIAADEALSLWLGRGISAQRVREAAARVRSPGVNVQTALRAWSATQTRDALTQLAIALAEPGPNALWVRILIRCGIDEVAFVSALADRVRASDRGEDRKPVINLLAGVRFTDPAAYRRLGQLAVSLFDSHTQVDFNLGLRLIPALGTNHQSGRPIRDAIDRATEANTRLRLSKKNVEDLHHAGIRPRQRNLQERALKKFKSLWD